MNEKKNTDKYKKFTIICDNVEFTTHTPHKKKQKTKKNNRKKQQ